MKGSCLWKSVIFSAGFNSIYYANILGIVPRGLGFTPYQITIPGHPSTQVMWGQKKRHLRAGLTAARGRGSIHQEENNKENCAEQVCMSVFPWDLATQKEPWDSQPSIPSWGKSLCGSLQEIKQRTLLFLIMLRNSLMDINMGYWQWFCEPPHHLEEILTCNSHHTRGALVILVSCALPPAVKSLLLCTEELESY